MDAGDRKHELLLWLHGRQLPRVSGHNGSSVDGRVGQITPRPIEGELLYAPRRDSMREASVRTHPAQAPQICP